MVRLFQLTSALSVVLISSALAAPQTIMVSEKTLSKTLYFQGTIQPQINVPVISTTAGAVSKVMFNYGQYVKKGTPLLQVDSGKVLNNLRNAEVAYLKAVQAFNKIKDWQGSSQVLNARNSLARAKRNMLHAQTTYQQNKTLYQSGVLSYNDLQQSSDNYQDDLMSYQQAKQSLTAALNQGEGSNYTVAKLQLANAEQKYLSLQKQAKSTTVVAPANGVILIPTQTNMSSSNKSSSNRIQVGSSIDYQQVLMTIGNLSGLKIKLQVPEVNINAIHVNQAAAVSGSAFPNVTLHGHVDVIAAQASVQNSGGNALPTFMVEVTAPHISANAARLIRVGMEAQVALTIASKNKALMVPVRAVHQDKNGQGYVLVYDKKNDKTHKQTITTGQVSLNNVVVTHGLHAGQSIVISNGH